MGNLNCDSCVVKSPGTEIVRNEEKSATPNRPPSMVDNGSKLFFVIYAGTLLLMYNLLVQFLRLKYKGKKETPFQTQSFLINTSIVAFLVAGLTATILVYDYLPSLTKKLFPPVVYMIMKIAFSLSGIIANISLVLILIID